MCDLKIAEMNLQCSLIQELRLYKFKLGHNAMEVNKNICHVKNAGAVDHSTVARWFKKFYSGCKNLDYQARLHRPKIADSEIGLQAIEANPMSSTWRVSGKLGLSKSSVVRQVWQKKPERMNCSTCYQNNAKLLTHSSIFFLLKCISIFH